MSRHYYRCNDCLATMTAEFDRPITVTCGICGGTVEYLGEVRGDAYTRLEDRCPCDRRCTDASGPNCECQCGGENHGAGLSADVTVIADSGKVKITPPGDNSKHIRQAEEFRAAVGEAKARLARLPHWEEYTRGQWIGDKRAWLKCNLALTQYRKAKQYKTHPKRIKALSEVGNG